MWEKAKKIGYYLVIPLVLVFALIRVFTKFTISSANRSLEKVTKKDKELKKEQNAFIKESEIQMEEGIKNALAIEELHKRLNGLDEDEDDEEWHKKWEKSLR